MMKDEKSTLRQSLADKISNWARANGYDWTNESICREAAKGGHLEVLEWTRGEVIGRPATRLLLVSTGALRLASVGH